MSSGCLLPGVYHRGFPPTQLFMHRKRTLDGGCGCSTLRPARDWRAFTRASRSLPGPSAIAGPSRHHHPTHSVPLHLLHPSLLSAFLILPKNMCRKQWKFETYKRLSDGIIKWTPPREGLTVMAMHHDLTRMPRIQLYFLSCPLSVIYLLPLDYFGLSFVCIFEQKTRSLSNSKQICIPVQGCTFALGLYKVETHKKKP